MDAETVNDNVNTLENQTCNDHVEKHECNDEDNDVTLLNEKRNKKKNKNKKKIRENEVYATVTQFDEDTQTKILLHLGSDDEAGLAFVYDSGSSITVLNNEMLFINKISEVKGVNVRNSSGLYKINKQGDAMSFSKCFYDKRQFINIVSEYAVLNNDNVVVEEIKNSNGMKVGYNLYIKDVDVTLYCRWQNGVMIGSFKPLLQKHNSIYAMRPAKSKINIKSMAKYEKAIGKVHKVMRRMGYQSKEEAGISISKGYIFNAPVNSRDFQYAADGFGPPKHFKLGAATIDSKLPYEDLVTQCNLI